jgi:hypothetical protein
MVRILCVHGVGHQEADPSWLQEWENTIRNAVTAANPVSQVEFDSVPYDNLFDFSLSAKTIALALLRLTASGVNSALSDMGNWLSNLFGRRRDLVGDISQQVGWTAGMVVHWAGDNRLRARCRERVLEKMESFHPDVVCAHSLGSMICYDTFVRDTGKDAIADKVFVSFGSQIGNDFVKGTFGGRLDLTGAATWYHLFNKNDWVFTAPIRDSATNFEQVEADFMDPPLNHSALHYLDHENVHAQVWSALAQPRRRKALATGVRAIEEATAAPRRALLVGINNYPDPRNRLEGCVNDVFLMSAVLQESGFAPDEIRVVLDERATAAGITERLQWLLDNVRAGDQRVLYYSGHGARIPGYGLKGTPDRLHSCLVPYDFNWSGETAITDDKLDDFYSELPYDSRFVIVLDCCYSGGMARDGGMRVRGINPPDDIRHRMLRWDADHEMWVPRELDPPNPDLTGRKYGNEYVGPSGAERRLGRAVGLRILPDRQYNRVRAELHHQGPYLPMIYEACQENQFSYEYRHGVTSYGAFTYSVSRILRRSRTRGTAITFETLLQEVKQTLADLKYDQIPALLGPKDLLKSRIPWLPGARGSRKRGHDDA